MGDKKAVALSLVGTFVILMADEGLVKTRAPSPRKIVSFAVVFLILGFLVEVSPKPAKYLSILLFIGTVFKIGPEVWVKAKAGLSGGSPAPTRAPVRTFVPPGVRGPVLR